MCRSILLPFFLTLSLFLHAQVACKPVQEQIVRTISRSPKVMSNDKYYYSQNEFTISFVGNFQDSLRIYVGNNLVFDDFVLTDGSPGRIRHNIRIPFRDKDEQPLMKIFFLNKNVCLTESLSFLVPILEVKAASNRWYLTYTNHFASLE